jgi:hypothetical protein
MLEQWLRTRIEVNKQNLACVLESLTYNTPFKAEEDLTNQEDLLAGCEENNEKEAAHDHQSAEHNLSWSESGDEPAIENGA